jgi:two-component system sensor histidine kinase DesK
MPADPMSNQHQRNWAWVLLTYTGFLFLKPILEPGPYLWPGTLVVLATFLGIFYGYLRASKQSVRFWMIGATFALGLATFPWNQGASTFFVYAAAFLPFSIESVRRVLWLILVECFIILVEGYVFSLHVFRGPFYIGWPNTLVAIFLVVVIGGGNIFFAAQKRAECKLRTALEENLALAAVVERERIARDLHDVLGHTLSVIVLKAELAGRLVPLDPKRAISEIADVEVTARSALAEIREAIGGYRARGLAAEIKAARLTLDAAGVVLLVENNPINVSSLSPKDETALALALREAVTNVVRHARATTCRLRFTIEAERRRLIIEDDGQHTATHEGNGLRGMRERMESLGGNFSIELGIERGRGTRLILELPLREVAAS